MKNTSLWSATGTDLSDSVADFLAGSDRECDQILFAYDLQATAAHVRGLERIGVLAPQERDALIAALQILGHELETGHFIFDERFEDSHSAIEWFLTNRLGELGAKVHTGRSRNDQVLVALRLYERRELETIARLVLGTVRELFSRTRSELLLPMPGYTHSKPAMVTSRGLWWGGFLESLLDDLELLRATYGWIDANPLGTGSGFGVNLPLDREGVSRELGFSRLLLNPHAAQLSRGKYELQVIQACLALLLDWRRMAWDLLFFQTEEFGFCTWPESLATGSSLMPGKRNPDLLELLRAAVAPVLGCWVELASLQSLPSGYQRDQQLGKRAAIAALSETKRAATVVPLVVRAVQWNEERIQAALKSGLYRTDLAFELSANGLPFREAYRRAAQAGSHELERFTALGSLQVRCSPGAPGNPRLEQFQKRIEELELWLETVERQRPEAAW